MNICTKPTCEHHHINKRKGVILKLSLQFSWLYQKCILVYHVGLSWSWSYSSWIYSLLYMQSVPITTKVMCLNLVHGEVYLIQHYVIKFVSELLQVGGFLSFPPLNKTDRCNITEILLKVVLNTITLLFHVFLPSNHISS